jgi:UDP-N-acetylglucosamine 3-dehydrogenase
VPELRIGLIGCGRLAERGYVPALSRTAGVELTAVADPVAERCATAAPDVRAFRSAVELLAAGVADALVLATPAEAHLPDARAAAAAGVPTLIEKPPAATLAEALEVARLDPAPHFAFNRRFVPELALLRSELQRHGRVELALDMRTRPRSWRSYVAAEDVLLNLGPHLVDLARWLSGAEISSVSAAVTDASASLDVELADGRGRARIACSEGPYRERVTSPAGRYATGGLLNALRLRLAGTSREHPLVPSLARQLAAFARAVRGELEPDLARVRDGVAVMATLEAARASAARKGARMTIESG